MEEGALNGTARPGSGAPHEGAEWGKGRGGGCSQPKRSETGLIGRRWSCGGTKGVGITCRSAAHGGGAVRRGEGMGVGTGARGQGRVCRTTELDPQRYRVGELGPGGQSKPRIKEGHSRGLGEE